MTENEAKTKWCPFARNTNYMAITPAFNRVEGEPAIYCIGSACMAWRWNVVSEETKAQMQAQGLAPADRVDGFCGLAGRT